VVRDAQLEDASATRLRDGEARAQQERLTGDRIEARHARRRGRGLGPSGEKLLRLTGRERARRRAGPGSIVEGRGGPARGRRAREKAKRLEADGQRLVAR